MQNISKKQIKKIGKMIGKLISILSILFVIYAIWKLGFDFQSIRNWPLFLGISLVGVILKTITVYISGSAWISWLRFFARHEFNSREGICVYAKANIGKYLPGNVMHYVERNLFATNLGISQKKLAVSTILEVLGLVSVAFFLAIFVSANQLKKALYEIFGANYYKIVVLAVVVVVVGAIILFLILRKKIVPILKEYTLCNFLKTMVLALLRYAVVLVTLGVIMVALYAYMGGSVTWENGTIIVSGYIIAWVLGFVVPGASGGIGIRELVITVLLGSVMGADIVVTLSVIHRLITIIGDFLAYLIRLAIWRENK